MIVYIFILSFVSVFANTNNKYDNNCQILVNATIYKENMINFHNLIKSNSKYLNCVDDENDYKESLLHLAVKYDRFEVIEYFLINGANPNIINAYEETPIEYEIKKIKEYKNNDKYLPNPKIIKILFDYGAIIKESKQEELIEICINYGYVNVLNIFSKNGINIGKHLNASVIDIIKLSGMSSQYLELTELNKNINFWFTFISILLLILNYIILCKKN